MGEVIAFDHIHLISRDPKAAADWYQEMFGGEIAAEQPNLRGAPQIDVRVGGMTIVIRGHRRILQPRRVGDRSLRLQLSRGSAGILRGTQTKRRVHGGGAVGIQTRIGALLCRRARWRQHRDDSGESLAGKITFQRTQASQGNRVSCCRTTITFINFQLKCGVCCWHNRAWSTRRSGPVIALHEPG
jgi:catechol 2,3-dioxygenase-like lactoylglutathione lyase family enzyme